MSIQLLVNSINYTSREGRSKYHLTLGKLIKYLEPYKESDIPLVLSDDHTKTITYPHSYRGYYSDLAYEVVKRDSLNTGLVTDLYDRISGSLNSKYTGWKGGEFKMNEDTPLWLVTAQGMSTVKKGDKYVDTAIVDIYRMDKWIILKTKNVND